MIPLIARKPDGMERAFRCEMDALVGKRVPLAFALFIVLTSVASGFECFYYPERGPALVAVYAAYVFVVLVRIATFVLAPQWAVRSIPFSTNALPACVCAYFAWVQGNAEVLVIMLVVYL